MNSSEYIDFLKSVLVKIENAINLLDHKPPRHIPSYHKMLGVQQKLSGLNEREKNSLFPQMIATRSIINYFMNGRYEEANNQILKLKKELVQICLELEKKNERDKN